MKGLKIFGLFLVLHVAAWAGTHVYLSQHQPDVLIVVDIVCLETAIRGDGTLDFGAGSEYPLQKDCGGNG